MEVLRLKNDGRCRWLEYRVLRRLLPAMIEAAADPGQRKMYLIADWISSDGGKVGVDRRWLASLGVPVLARYTDAQPPTDYVIVNTGYDSIVDEERWLAERGAEIVDEPCPYIRKVRRIFEARDDAYQYVLLCDPNHIIVKNFACLYPRDLILVQMQGYEAEILFRQNGKPLRLVPYVTFLPSDVQRVFAFIQARFPERRNEVFRTTCMWAQGPSSPITEIDALDPGALAGVTDALLVTTPGSANRSLTSLVHALERRGLHVVPISSWGEFRAYDRMHRDRRVLLVRSPIPNTAEKAILKHLQYGRIGAAVALAADAVGARWRRHRMLLALRARTSRR